MPIRLLLLLLALGLSCGAAAQPAIDIDREAIRALSVEPGEADAAIGRLLAAEDPALVPVLVRLLRWAPDDRERLVSRLEALTGAKAGANWFDWTVWLQDHPEFQPSPGFAAFLAKLLTDVDPQFGRFVAPGVAHDIRLEEIVWGGLEVDGIPALDEPAMVEAAAARYLDPDDLVFGIEIGGDARAYPQRILAWHEMANDVVGGVPVSLAYCTLCGAAILFDARAPGRDKPFTFGTSSLLYRSNKLMYDRQTDSLWNQFTGRPVVGPLVGSGIALRVLPLVATRWAAWQRLHPMTKVLSLDTGYRRDYGSGVAYRKYFASPDLMFPASVKDGRLARKDRVFGVRLAGGTRAWPLAALKGQVVNDRAGLVDLVVVGDADGEGARAYESGGRRFAWGEEGALVAAGESWRMTEAALTGPGGKSLPRLPGHVAYWFAWSGFLENAALGTP